LDLYRRISSKPPTVFKMGKVFSVCKGCGASEERHKEGAFASIDTAGIRHEVGADGRLPKAWYTPNRLTEVSVTRLSEDAVAEILDETEADEPERLRAWRKEQHQMVVSQKAAEERLEAEHLQIEKVEKETKAAAEQIGKEKAKQAAEDSEKEEQEKVRIAKAKALHEAEMAQKEKSLKEAAKKMEEAAKEGSGIVKTLEEASSQVKEWLEGSSLVAERKVAAKPPTKKPLAGKSKDSAKQNKLWSMSKKTVPTGEASKVKTSDAPIQTVPTEKFAVLEVTPNIFFSTTSALAGRTTSGIAALGNGTRTMFGMLQHTVTPKHAISVEPVRSVSETTLSQVDLSFNELEDLLSPETPLKLDSTRKFAVLGVK
jgi:hypothetical protein